MLRAEEIVALVHEEAFAVRVPAELLSDLHLQQIQALAVSLGQVELRPSTVEQPILRDVLVLVNALVFE